MDIAEDTVAQTDYRDIFASLMAEEDPAPPPPDSEPSPSTHSRLMELLPGFYAFRYRCKGAGALPVARLAPQGGARSRVRLLGQLEDGAAVLSQRGDMAVVHVAEAPGAVRLVLSIPRGFPERAVDIHVERLAQEGPKPARAPKPALNRAEPKSELAQPQKGSIARTSGRKRSKGKRSR